VTTTCSPRVHMSEPGDPEKDDTLEVRGGRWANTTTTLARSKKARWVLLERNMFCRLFPLTTPSLDKKEEQCRRLNRLRKECKD
jgi:hypothetical protein